MAENTTESRRDWIKITALALIPTLAAALVTLTLNRSASGAEAGTLLTSTTTAPFEPGASGSDADGFEVPHQSVGQPGSDQDGDQEAAEEETPANQPEQPDDPPAPAKLELPTEVKVSGDKASIEVSNGGELPLEIYLVDVNGHPIEVGETPAQVDGGATEVIPIEVDTTDLGFGPYEMTMTVSTSDGVGHVEVTGTKLAILVPILPSLDIGDSYIVPHQANLLEITVTNDEAHEVTVGLSSDDDRLDFPDEVVLAPGENEIALSIQALAVHWSVIDLLELTFSYGATEMGTVTITKHGS